MFFQLEVIHRLLVYSSRSDTQEPLCHLGVSVIAGEIGKENLNNIINRLIY